jgi:hypothetical protein
MIQTAFQIGGFQFSGFQEGLPLSGGGGAQRRRLLFIPRIEPDPDPTPTLVEIETIIAQARERTRIAYRTRKPVRVLDMADLSRLRATRDKEELAEFEAFMRLIAEMDTEGAL